MKRPLIERILISCDNLLAKAWGLYGDYLRRKRDMYPPISSDYASVLERESKTITVTLFEGNHESRDS